MPSLSDSVAMYWALREDCSYLPTDMTRAQYLERVAIARAKLILLGENPDSSMAISCFIGGMSPSYRLTATQLMRFLPVNATFLQVIQPMFTVDDNEDLTSSTNAIVNRARTAPGQDVHTVPTVLKRRCNSARATDYIGLLSNELIVRILRYVLCWDRWICFLSLPPRTQNDDKGRPNVFFRGDLVSKKVLGVLGTCKWLNKFGNPILYGENGFVGEPEALVEWLAYLPTEVVKLIRRIYITPHTKTGKGYKRTVIEQLFRQFPLDNCLRSCWLVAREQYVYGEDIGNEPLRRLHNALRARRVFTNREDRAGLGASYFETPVGRESADLKWKRSGLTYVVLFDDRDEGKFLPRFP